MWRRSTPTAICPRPRSGCRSRWRSSPAASHQPGGGRRGWPGDLRGHARPDPRHGAGQPQRAGRHLAGADRGGFPQRDALDPAARPRAVDPVRQRHAVDVDQAKITAEVAQLTAELVRIRDSSKFNGIALFSSAGLTFQVGSNGNVDRHDPAADSRSARSPAASARSPWIVSPRIDTALTSVGLYDVADSTPR